MAFPFVFCSFYQIIICITNRFYAESRCKRIAGLPQNALICICGRLAYISLKKRGDSLIEPGDKPEAVLHLANHSSEYADGGLEAAFPSSPFDPFIEKASEAPHGYHAARFRGKAQAFRKPAVDKHLSL